MTYSTTDAATNLTERKNLKIEKNASTGGNVRIDLTCFSNENGANMGIEIQHSDMIAIQTLAEVDLTFPQYSLPYITGWHALQGRETISDDLDEASSNSKHEN